MEQGEEPPQQVDVDAQLNSMITTEEILAVLELASKLLKFKNAYDAQLANAQVQQTSQDMYPEGV